MDQPFTLADAITNVQLARRPPRGPDYQAEIEAMNILAETLAHCPQTLLQKLVKVAQQLCRADSAELVCWRSAGANTSVGGKPSLSLARSC